MVCDSRSEPTARSPSAEGLVLAARGIYRAATRDRHDGGSACGLLPFATEPSSPVGTSPTFGGVTGCTPDGVGAARLVAARDSRRRRAVHETGQLGAGRVAAVR